MELRDPSRSIPRRLKPGAQIETAIHYDLLERASADLGRSLEFVDYEHDGGGRSRNADRYVHAGRRRLHQLGAWPWSITPVLPRNWRMSKRFARPLAFWHYLSWTDSYVELHLTSNPLRDTPLSYYSSELRRDAHRAYLRSLGYDLDELEDQEKRRAQMMTAAPREGERAQPLRPVPNRAQTP
jgi:hypothetical protein